MNRTAIFPRSLKYLLAVAEYSSFTRAAESLFVSQPALSQQIKQLEDRVGVQLLERSGRNVHLTDAGELYVRHVERALAEINAASAALDDLSDLSRGSVSLALTPITDYLTVSLIQEFVSQHPNISLDIKEMTQHEVEEAVLQDSVNVGVMFSNQTSLTTGRDELETMTLSKDSLVLASSKAQSANGGGSHQDSSMELMKHPLALLETRFEMRRQIDAYFTSHGLSPRVTLEANSLGFLIEMVKRGGFRTILPGSIVASVDDLVPIPVDPVLPTHTATIIIRKAAYRSRATDAFLRLALLWDLPDAFTPKLEH
ncbi:MAG: transcriptional regulator CynR [Arenicellales bacterium]